MVETETVTLPDLPLRNGVVFPNMVVTVGIESDEASRALSAAEANGGRLVLVPRLDGAYATVGTIADLQEISDGSSRSALIAGISRARIGAGRPGDEGVLWVEVEPVSDPGDYGETVLAKAQQYRAVVAEILEERGMRRAADRFLATDDPGQLADLAVYSPDVTLEHKVDLLETIDVEQRLDLALGFMEATLADLTLRRRIRDDTAERIDKNQREYLLRQQLDAIKSELGEGDGSKADDYRTRLAEAEMPEAVSDVVEREIDRFERTSEQSPEHSWIDTWLSTVFELPWGSRTDDRLELDAARAVLDADHTGLDEVKERIVEHLAVRRLRAERSVDPEGGGRGDGAVLLLVGPPGVGKTSLGQSVARALGRNFGRVSLGGIRDEAEVRGHRRTYVGARPGRIARALIDAGSLNPVLLLDEIDKVGGDWRGDPSSALLEVLDPAQNHTFRDHYLEFDLDLSEVLFIATANVADAIPAPLLDRTELIALDGYTVDEKVEIGREHLLSRRLESGGLVPDELIVTDAALAAIVDGYTREAGVRNLERQLGKLVRKAATHIVTGEGESTVTVDADGLVEFLGKPRFYHDEVGDRTSVPGVATGLAVTGAGGDVLFIEATRMDAGEGLTLTGQLGDIMKESAQIALSYVQANAEGLDIDPDSFSGGFHVHVPAGAVPKDGPSAGIAMTAALVSLLTGRKVKDSVGMTGEVTLQGRVLPIGGVKQKVLAAHRAGLEEVILPARNEIDLDDIPQSVADEMTFHVLDDVRAVIELALE